MTSDKEIEVCTESYKKIFDGIQTSVSSSIFCKENNFLGKSEFVALVVTLLNNSK